MPAMNPGKYPGPEDQVFDFNKLFQQWLAAAFAR
jgi:hypothetical protein